MKTKLVRDKIPLMCNERGETRFEFRIAKDDAEYKSFLYEKLREEVEEFLANGETEELVDLATVVNAILDLRKISDIDFGKLYFSKIESNGYFRSRVIMSVAP